MKLSLRSVRQIALLGVLALLSSLALALPTPKDISQAVAEGKLADAEKMLREVIAEKPGSAKAHYELAEVLAREGRLTQALSEMDRAKGIDPTLHFAQSPDKFNEVLADINQAIASQSATHRTASPSTSTTSHPATMNAPNPSASLGANMPWGLIMLLVGGVVLLVLWRQRPSSLAPSPNPMPVQTPQTPTGFGAQYTPGGPTYAPTYPPTYAPSSGTGSGVAGAVVGGLAGVAAGYALSKALEGREHTPGQVVERSGDDGFVPINPAGGGSDVSPDFGRFDQGSGGDDWAPEQSSQDDDNW
jgi:hypothetical protein